MKVRDNINQFLRHYERDYYKHDYERLSFCLPVFHYIAHVADALLDIGPQYVYTQWCVERACGTLSRGCKSRAEANRNISLNILRMESYNHLVYTISKESFYVTTGLDLTNEDEVEMMKAKATRMYVFMRKMLSRGAYVDGAGNRGAHGPNRRSGGNIHLEFSGKQPFETITKDIRRLLKESRGSDVWKQCTAEDWDILAMQRFSTCRYLTATSVATMYSSTLKPDKLKRQAYHCIFEAFKQIRGRPESEVGAFVGEIMFYFDIVSTDGDDERCDDIITTAPGMSLAVVKSYNLRNEGHLRILDKRGGRLMVVPAVGICDIVGYVVKGEKYYLCHRDTCLQVD